MWTAIIHVRYHAVVCCSAACMANRTDHKETRIINAMCTAQGTRLAFERMFVLLHSYVKCVLTFTINELHKDYRTMSTLKNISRNELSLIIYFFT
jgi:hypothetical protein